MLRSEVESVLNEVLREEVARLRGILDAAIANHLAEIRCDKSNLTPDEWQAANVERAETFAVWSDALEAEVARRATFVATGS